MRLKALLIAVFIAAIIAAPSAYAANPSQIAPDTNALPANYQFQLYGNSPSTYLKFDTNFYADKITIAGTQINFTNTAFGAANNPALSFGLNIVGGNATVASLTNSNLNLNLTATNGATVTTTFYYSATGWGTYPQQIDLVSGGTKTSITSANILSSQAAFNAAAAPAAYYDSVNQLVQAKVVESGSTSVSFLQSIVASGNGGGGGGGGGGPPPPPPPPNNPPPPPPPPNNPPPLPINNATLQMTAKIPSYYLSAGANQTQTMTVSVTGTTAVLISSITFSNNPSWFSYPALPTSGILAANASAITIPIPISLSLPSSVSITSPQTLYATVTAQTTNAATQVTVPISIIPTAFNLPPGPIPCTPAISQLCGGPLNDPFWNLMLVFIVVLIIAIVVKQGTTRKRRR